MRILVFEPLKEPYVRDIEDDIHAMQEVVGGSVSSSWRILEADVPTKYYLSPAQCAHFLKLAEIAGCPPPKEIEALFLKQGGAYPSPDPFNASVCGHRPKIGRQKRSETASDYQLTLFPLF